MHYFCHKYLSVRACPLLERGQGTSPKIQSLAQPREQGAQQKACALTAQVRRGEAEVAFLSTH